MSRRGGGLLRLLAPAEPRDRTKPRSAGTMTLASLALALMLGALPEAVSVDPRRGYLHHRRPPPAGPQHQDSSPTPQQSSGTSPPLPRAVQARRAPGLFSGVCPAGALWVNETARGARCLRWAEVPAFLERPPPEGWASLRGQRHNFCRSPDGAGAPWCFYRSAPGKADWGYCGCRRGEWWPAARAGQELPGRGGRGRPGASEGCGFSSGGVVRSRRSQLGVSLKVVRADGFRAELGIYRCRWLLLLPGSRAWRLLRVFVRL